MRARVLVAAAALAVAGCTGTSSPDAEPSVPQTGPPAALDPCPASDGSGGGLPDFTLPCLGEGPDVALTGLRGVPTLVNIWATWCGPCQKEVPVLQQVYDDARGRLRVLGVDTEDSDNSARSFAAAVGMSYPSVVDRDGNVLRRLGYVGPPATLFVDADGQVVKGVNAPYDDVADLRADVRRYLGVRLP